MINTNVSLKAFLASFDKYLATELFGYRVSITDKRVNGYYADGKLVAGGRSDITRQKGIKVDKNNYAYQHLFSIQNKAIMQVFARSGAASPQFKIENCWVRWGWFEDNILPKFLSLTEEGGRIITKFRSIERIMNAKDSTPEDAFESVRVRNNENLETVDINSYILPGQFRPATSRTVFVDGEEITIPGDEDLLIRLKNEVDKFNSFSTGEGKGSINRYTESIIEELVKDRGVSYTRERQIKGLQPIPSPGRFGYLRNMLINTKVIRSAFNANLGEGETIQPTEPINIFESVENIFRDINTAGGLNYWNFQLKEDELEDGTIKIIDDATTAVDFNVPGKKDTKFSADNKIEGNPSVFYFPVWQSDSIVKRQNVTTKIPNSIQLATMYGSNVDLAAEFENHATTFDAVGVAAGAFTNGNDDKGLTNVNIAIKNEKSKQIGLKSGNESKSLTFTGGEDVLTFLNENVLNTLEEAYKGVTDDIKERQEKEAQLIADEEVRKLFNDSLPIPSLDFMSDDDLRVIFNTTYNKILIDQKTEEERLRIIKSFAQSFGAKFLNGVVRNKFLSFINERIVGYGTSNNEDIPILIPFEIELDIDGIGGIYPANAFHSYYLPQKYQDAAIFQAKDVNHRVDDTGWTTTLSGVMRSTLHRVLLTNAEYADLHEKYINNYKGKIQQALAASEKDRASSLERQTKAYKKFGDYGLGFVILKDWLTNVFTPKEIDSGVD